MAKRASKLEEPAVTPEEAEATTLVAEEPATDATAAEAPVDVAPEETEPVPAEPIEPEPDPRTPLDDPLMPGSVSINAAGTHAAFIQQDSSGMPWLWQLDLEMGDYAPIPLTTLSDSFTLVEEAPDGPQWSPDGQFLAVTARSTGSDQTHIRVVDVATGESAPLVRHNASDFWPRWSPDGEWIAFVSVRDGRQVIAVASSEGGGPATQLTLPDRGQIDREPTWDVKGGRLAFLRSQPAVDTNPAGDHIWSVELAGGEQKQLTKKVLGRHSLRWGPTRPLILHVVKESDWEHIAVVNADNQASWTISSEQGDKSDPQWSSDGNRVVFLRSKGGLVSCCDRATSAASSEALESEPGRAWSPRWLPSPAENRLAFYLFSPATGGPRAVIQQNKKDAERRELPVPGGWDPGERKLVSPQTVELTLAEKKASGLLYRKPEGSGPAPAVILLGARPDESDDAGYNAKAQALAAAGFAVFTPVLPGARGAGRKLADARAERADSESEVEDLLDIIATVEENDGVLKDRVAVVGEGYGGALALVLAGSRPDAVQGVVAIDPIVDWDITLDQCDSAMRDWFMANYGLPLANAGRYALRSPATFAGVIDAPMLLIERTPDQVHIPLLESVLSELGRVFWSESAVGESTWAVYARAATFLAKAFRGTLEPPVVAAPEALAEAEPVTPEVAEAKTDLSTPEAETPEAGSAPVEDSEPVAEAADEALPEVPLTDLLPPAAEAEAMVEPEPAPAPEPPKPPEKPLVRLEDI